MSNSPQNSELETDSQIQARLLQELNEMSFTEDENSKSELSEGERSLQEPYLEYRQERGLNQSIVSRKSAKVHEQFLNQMEKQLNANNMIKTYIFRKNEKNLRKEENIEDNVSIATEGMSINQSAILKGSVFNEFDDYERQDILKLREVNNFVMGRNQIEEMKQNVEIELERYKEGNPDIFKDDESVDIEDLPGYEEEILARQLENKHELENQALTQKMEEKKRQFEQDHKDMRLNCERNQMLEEDQLAFDFRLETKIKKKQKIKNRILDKVRVQRTQIIEIQSHSKVELRQYQIIEAINFGFPDSEIGSEKIKKIEKNQSIMYKSIQNYYSGLKIPPLSIVNPKIKSKNQISTNNTTNQVSNANPKEKIKKVEIILNYSPIKTQKMILDEQYDTLKQFWQNRNLKNILSSLIDSKNMEILTKMYLSGCFPVSSLVSQTTIEELNSDPTLQSPTNPKEFLIKLCHSNRGLSNLLELSNFTSNTTPNTIDILDCSSNEMDSISGKENTHSQISGFLEKLIEINISQNKISEIDYLSKLKNLRILNGGFNQMTKIVKNPKIQFTNILALNLSNNNINSSTGLSCFRSLKFLNLSGNKIKKLEDIEQCPLLEKVDISRNIIEELPNFASNQLLRVVVAFGNEISSVKSLNLLFLKELHLSDNNIENIDFDIICPHLKFFNLKNNKITNLDPCTSIVLHSLEIFNISFNPMPLKEAIRLFKYMPKVSNLEYYGVKKLGRLELLMQIYDSFDKLESFNDQLCSISPSIVQRKSKKQPPKNSDFLLSEFFSRSKNIEHLFEVSEVSGYHIKNNKIFPRGLLCSKIYKNQLDIITFKTEHFAKFFISGQLKSFKKVLKLKLAIDTGIRLKIQKVKNFLISVLLSRRRLKAYYQEHIQKIVKIQKNIRGFLTRKIHNFYSNPLIYHKSNLPELITIQKHFRGYLTRKRFMKMFGGLKVKDDDSASEQSDMMNYFDGDFNVETGLEIPDDLMNFFQKKPPILVEAEQKKQKIGFETLKEVDENEEYRPSTGKNSAHSSAQSSRSFKIGQLRLDSSSNSSTYSQQESLESQNNSSFTNNSNISNEVIGSRASKRSKGGVSSNNRSKMNHQTLDIIEEWGFKQETIKKTLQFRIQKEKKRKKKQKKLSASEKYELLIRKRRNMGQSVSDTLSLARFQAINHLYQQKQS